MLSTECDLVYFNPIYSYQKPFPHTLAVQEYRIAVVFLILGIHTSDILIMTSLFTFLVII